jgi:hypothetical protein
MDTPFQNLELERGDDEDLVISFYQSDGETEVPFAEIVDVRFTVRTKWATTEANNSSAVWATTYVDDSQISAFGSNAVLLEIPVEVTLLLAQALATAGKPLKYDVEILTAAGKTITTQKGNLTIGADVSRP